MFAGNPWKLTRLHAYSSSSPGNLRKLTVLSIFFFCGKKLAHLKSGSGTSRTNASNTSFAWVPCSKGYTSDVPVGVMKFVRSQFMSTCLQGPKIHWSFDMFPEEQSAGNLSLGGKKLWYPLDIFHWTNQLSINRGTVSPVFETNTSSSEGRTEDEHDVYGGLSHRTQSSHHVFPEDFATGHISSYTLKHLPDIMYVSMIFVILMQTSDVYVHKSSYMNHHAPKTQQDIFLLVNIPAIPLQPILSPNKNIFWYWIYSFLGLT